MDLHVHVKDLHLTIHQDHDCVQAALAVRLAAASMTLQAAITLDAHSPSTPGVHMTSPILSDLETSVTNATTVMASATALINGIGARIQAAIDAAILNGATASELAPVQTEADALKNSSADLSAAVQANTPAQP